MIAVSAVAQAVGIVAHPVAARHVHGFQSPAPPAAFANGCCEVPASWRRTAPDRNPADSAPRPGNAGRSRSGAGCASRAIRKFHAGCRLGSADVRRPCGTGGVCHRHAPPPGSTSRKRLTAPSSVFSATLPPINAWLFTAQACSQSITCCSGRALSPASMAKPVVNISGKTMRSRPTIGASNASKAAGWRGRRARPAVAATG